MSIIIIIFVIMYIDPNLCFECGAPKDENHHVIPKSRGGTKTVPLCFECHGKAHDIERRRLWIEAANKGRAKYVKNGGKLGRKVGSKKSISKTLKEHKDIVKYLKMGCSVRETMTLTSKSSGTVQKIKKLLDHGILNEKDVELLNKHEDVVKYLKSGYSIRNVMSTTNKSSGTIQKVKKILNRAT